MWNLKKAELIETESRMMVARDWGSWGNGDIDWSKGTNLQL